MLPAIVSVRYNVSLHMKVKFSHFYKTHFGAGKKLSQYNCVFTSVTDNGNVELKICSMKLRQVKFTCIWASSCGCEIYWPVASVPVNEQQQNKEGQVLKKLMTRFLPTNFLMILPEFRCMLLAPLSETITGRIVGMGIHNNCPSKQEWNI